MVINEEETLAVVVESSIKVNKDLLKLEELAKDFCPENESMNRFSENYINMYLDDYNRLQGTSKMKYVGGGNFKFQPLSKKYSRKLALWNTYIHMLEDVGIEVEGWSYNPNKTYIS